MFVYERADSDKWAQYYECSENEGDWGCDSCYHAIFGVWVDTYSLYTDSIVYYE